MSPLIKLLLEGGKLSTAQMAQVLNLPEAEINRQLEQLRADRILLGWRPVLNLADEETGVAPTLAGTVGACVSDPPASRNAAAASRVNDSPWSPSWLSLILTDSIGFVGSSARLARTVPLSPTAPLTGVQFWFCVPSA
jgi:DNA-binding Lrp family transcriptional regulator